MLNVNRAGLAGNRTRLRVQGRTCPKRATVHIFKLCACPLDPLNPHSVIIEIISDFLYLLVIFTRLFVSFTMVFSSPEPQCPEKHTEIALSLVPPNQFPSKVCDGRSDNQPVVEIILNVNTLHTKVCV